MESSQQVLTKIIALNNLGVSLLERRCYEQASVTLKDTVALLKASVKETHLLAEKKLHEALQRTNQPKPSRKSVNLEVIASNSILSRTEFCSSRVVALQVEDLDYTKIGHEVTSAIIFHNFGVSYYCLSKISSRQAKCAAGKPCKYANGALRLFKISHSLFTKSLDEQIKTQFPELLHVMVVSLNTLIRTLDERQRHSEAQPLRFLLSNLQSSIQETKNMFSLDNGAAAAA